MESIAQIKKINPVGYNASIKAIVIDAIQTSGVKNMTEEDKQVLLAKVLQVVRDYPYLSGSELRFAVREGALGRYGEYYGLSALTFDKWLRAYLASPEREANIRRNVKPVQLQLSATSTVTETEKDNILKKAIQAAYEKYLSGNKEFYNKPLERQVQRVRENFLKALRIMQSQETIVEFFERLKQEKQKRVFE